jgi:hypothetical protein
MELCLSPYGTFARSEMAHVEILVTTDWYPSTLVGDWIHVDGRITGDNQLSSPRLARRSKNKSTRTIRDLADFPFWFWKSKGKWVCRNASPFPRDSGNYSHESAGHSLFLALSPSHSIVYFLSHRFGAFSRPLDSGRLQVPPLMVLFSKSGIPIQIVPPH